MSIIGDIVQAAGTAIGTSLGGPVGGLLGNIAGGILGDIANSFASQIANAVFGNANLPVDINQLFSDNYSAAFAQGFGS